MPTKFDFSNKLVIWILGVVIAINTSVMGWNCTQIVSLLQWKAEVNASRFTDQDGRAVWEEIYKIRQDIVRMPNEYPPKWFLDSFNELKRDVKELKERTYDSVKGSE